MKKRIGAYYTLGETYSARDLLTTTLAVSADPLAYQMAKRDRDKGKITTEQLTRFWLHHPSLFTHSQTTVNPLVTKSA